MKRVRDYAKDVYSQFGEDGCIAYIFNKIGVQHRVCVEFGAGDGLDCSNTAQLWRDKGWQGVLIEPDPQRFELLLGNTQGFNTLCVETFVTPTGPMSIDSILEKLGIEGVDLMSIDIDGDDFFVLQNLSIRPRVIVIEFNPTVPVHLELRQAEPGAMFAASLLAIVRLAQEKGYRFVGATYCNAFLVDEVEASAFDGYETTLAALFPPDRFTYAVTDLEGRAVLVGRALPWAVTGLYVRPLVGTPVAWPSFNVAQIRESFEAEWGPAVWMTPTDFAAETVALSHGVLRDLLAQHPPLVCIDMSNDAPGTEGWMVQIAEALGYCAMLVGRVLGLRHRKEP